MLKPRKEILEQGMKYTKASNRNSQTNLKLLQSSCGSRIEYKKNNEFIKVTYILKLSKYSKQ